jgi:mevalonate kinase
LYGRLVVPSEGEVSASDSAYVNKWAFLSEKVIHGTPSGVDNSVSVHGGAIAFTRAHSSNTLTANEMEKLKGFSCFRFLLVDSCVGREGKKLIAHVAGQKEAEPLRVDAALARIQRISDAAKELLVGSVLPRSEVVRQLSSLIQQNHAELVALQVSHSSLELIRHKTESFGRGQLSTKLTGAGGGGCAVTLLPDDFPQAEIAELVHQLTNAGFKCYETSVGGHGYGVLLPQDAQQAHEFKLHFQHDSLPASLVAWANAKPGWHFA